jgi:hypothetical protein
VDDTLSRYGLFSFTRRKLLVDSHRREAKGPWFPSIHPLGSYCCTSRGWYLGGVLFMS